MKYSVVLLAGLLLLLAPLQGQDFVWAQQIGGAAYDEALAVAADSSGNVYTVGGFAGVVDVDPGPGVVNFTALGLRDILVSKFDSAGNFVWARQMGGGTGAEGTAIAVDNNGNVYTTGLFLDTTDFDPGAGVANLTSVGSFDIFISKLDSAGNFVWAQRAGGFDDDSGVGVALDGSGNVYIVGLVDGELDIDPAFSFYDVDELENSDLFIARLDNAGNLLWSRQLSATGDFAGLGVAVDGSGNVYTTGVFEGVADFDPGVGVSNMTVAGGDDIFISKLNSAGNFVWARQMGGMMGDIGFGLVLDGSGNVYTTGVFEGVADFDPGVGVSNITAAGGLDIFVSKLDSAGNFVWARQMGGMGDDIGFDLAVDGSGNVYTTGSFRGVADFDPGVGVSNMTSAGGDEIFISKLNSAGNFVWARQMGGMGDDVGFGLAVDGSGNVYATGSFRGVADFDPGAGMFSLTPVGAADIFVAKYQGVPSAGPPPSISAGGIVLATLLPTVNTVSPLSIISVFGENFSTEMIANPNLDSEGKLATTLGGTCLMMNGQALPIFAIFPTQINAQVSADKTLGLASFTVVTDCATAAPISSAPLTIEIGRIASPTPQALSSGVEMATVEEATPGFFLFPPLAGDGLIAARFNADAIAVAPDGMFTDEFGTSRPAMPGEIIVLYGTGWGETTAGLTTGELATVAAELLPEANAMITFGGVVLGPEDVFYIGVTPFTAGLLQAVIAVPATAQPGNNQVVLTAYGKSTPVGPVIPVAAP